jgi:polar amino acid transport system permease protein
MIRPFGLDEFLFLLQAARWTVALSVMAFVGGGVLGGLIALGRISEKPALRRLSALFIETVQGTPVLIVLFLAYYALPMLGWRPPPILAAAFGFTIYASAFLAEIWRGCIEAVPRPQWEAAASLALTRPDRLRFVILPQALRLAAPPTVGFMVQIVKNTSVASIIGFVELARAGSLMNNATFQPLAVFGAVAAIYFLLCWPLGVASRYLERSLRAGHSR